MTVKLEESIIRGRADTSGSLVRSFRSFCMVETPSISPASTFMFRIWAPLTTWALAISKAASKFLSVTIIFLNWKEPEIVHLSPMLTKVSSRINCYRPESSILLDCSGTCLGGLECFIRLESIWMWDGVVPPIILSSLFSIKGIMLLA
jgi:hypothetical protein